MSRRGKGAERGPKLRAAMPTAVFLASVAVPLGTQRCVLQQSWCAFVSFGSALSTANAQNLLCHLSARCPSRCGFCRHKVSGVASITTTSEATLWLHPSSPAHPRCNTNTCLPMRRFGCSLGARSSRWQCCGTTKRRSRACASSPCSMCRTHGPLQGKPAWHLPRPRVTARWHCGRCKALFWVMLQQHRLQHLAWPYISTLAEFLGAAVPQRARSHYLFVCCGHG